MDFESDHVVVMDTNFVGRGRLQVSAMQKLAGRLSSRGHHIIVPEVVVWEWAHHAHEALTEAHLAMERASAMVDGSLGVAVPAVVVPDIDEVVEKVTAALLEVDGVTTLASEEVDAADAIRQQVLQVGVGIRKGGVKTGAADALVLASVTRMLDSYESVVLCTGDKVLGDAANALDERVTVASDQRALWAWHGLTTPGVADLALQIKLFLAKHFEEELSLGRGLGALSQGYNVADKIFDYARFVTEDVRQTDLDIKSISEVAVGDVEIVSGDEMPHLAVAELELCADAVLVNWFIGGPDGDLLDEWEDLPVKVVVQVTVELAADWTPQSVDVNGRALVALDECE
ncbi:MAG: hypothetical protein ACRD0L_01055 [Acidimicrobiales bacterium]